LDQQDAGNDNCWYATPRELRQKQTCQPCYNYKNEVLNVKVTTARVKPSSAARNRMSVAESRCAVGHVCR